jgi:hypothetical protein
MTWVLPYLLVPDIEMVAADPRRRSRLQQQEQIRFPICTRTRRSVDTLCSRVENDVSSDGYSGASAEVTVSLSMMSLEGPRAGGLCMPSGLPDSLLEIRSIFEWR